MHFLEVSARNRLVPTIYCIFSIEVSGRNMMACLYRYEIGLVALCNLDQFLGF